MTLQHEHQLSILEQSDLRRAWGVAREVAPRSLHRVDVLAGEHSGQRIRFRVVLNGLRYGRPCIARGAATNGVDDYQRGALRSLELGVDFLRCAHLLDAELGELLTHRGDESLIVHSLIPR